MKENFPFIKYKEIYFSAVENLIFKRFLFTLHVLLNMTIDSNELDL